MVTTTLALYYGIGLIVIFTIMWRRRPCGPAWALLPVFAAAWPLIALGELFEALGW